MSLRISSEFLKTGPPKKEKGNSGSWCYCIQENHLGHPPYFDQESVLQLFPKVAAMEEDLQNSPRFVFGTFVLDPPEEQLKCGSKPVPLAPKEFELLRVLVSRAGHLVHKEDLIKQVWPDTFVSDSSLARAISVLRAQLGYDAIRTVPKRGYVFELPVQVLPGMIEQSGGSDPAPEIKLADTGHVQIEMESGIVLPNSSIDGNGYETTQVPAGEHQAAKVLAGARTTLKWRLQNVFSVAVTALVLIAAIGMIGSRFHSPPAPNPETDRPKVTAQQETAGAVRLFVLNQGANTVSVLNGLYNKVEATRPMPADPRGAAILPDGSTAYIALNRANRVIALDARTHQVTAIIPVGNSPVGVAANPRPPFVYVANNYSNTVSVIDSSTNTVQRELAVGSVPTEIAVSPDGRRAIVTNQSGGTVSVIDGVANTVVGTIPVGSTPVGVAFTPDSRSAWVTLAGQDEVAIIDLAAEKVVRRVHVGQGPVRVAITHDGRSALVSNFFSNKITFVDTVSFRSSDEVDVGLNPVGVSFDPAGSFAYVVNYGSASVTVIEMKSRRVVRTLDVGTKPVEVAILPCYSLPCSAP